MIMAVYINLSVCYVLLLGASRVAPAPMDPFESALGNFWQIPESTSVPPREQFLDVSFTPRLDDDASAGVDTRASQPHSHHSIAGVQNSHPSALYPGYLIPEPLHHVQSDHRSSDLISILPLPDHLSFAEDLGFMHHANELSLAGNLPQDTQRDISFSLRPSREISQQPERARPDAFGYYQGEAEVRKALIPSSLSKLSLVSEVFALPKPKLIHTRVVDAQNHEMQDTISDTLFAGKLRWFSFPIGSRAFDSFQQMAYRNSRYVPPVASMGTQQSPWRQLTPELLIAKHRPQSGSLMDVESGHKLQARQFISVWSMLSLGSLGTVSERAYFGSAWIHPVDYSAANTHLKDVFQLLRAPSGVNGVSPHI